MSLLFLCAYDTLLADDHFKQNFVHYIFYLITRKYQNFYNIEVFVYRILQSSFTYTAISQRKHKCASVGTNKSSSTCGIYSCSDHIVGNDF